jgi:flagellar assembly factor FliW
MMELVGTRFGDLAYDPADLVVLDDGLIGFPRLQSFLLLEHRADSPFWWLQSIEEPALAFLLVCPHDYVENYAPEISESDANRIALTPDTPATIYTTATIPAGEVQNLTLNLAGPIVVNPECRKGIQLIIDDPVWPVRYRPYQESAAA